MAKGSVNKVMLIGNLGRDPEIAHTASGLMIANFGLATTSQWKSEQEKKELTEWHKIVIYGKLAEIAKSYLKKGSKVYIEGRIHYNKWEDKETGKLKYSTEIVCEALQLLDKKEVKETGNETVDLLDEIPF